jgi:invasion protein IalB
MAPMGVFLPTGVPIEIDGNALPKPMIFSRCLPPICEATGEATADSLNKFKKGNNATFYLYDRPGNGFPLKVSLEGFGAALTALDKL